ncbi:MAG: hypothetical protein CMO01_33545 [Thalassobius sp.]|nr:hypothetical protein [Paracoccaceae bacterium]MBT34614.1 hypothetical protein [Thalassovita sp.]
MPPRSVLFFATAVIGFGSAFSMTNVAVATMSPLWVAAGRSVIAMLALWAFLFATRRPVTFDRAHLKLYISIGTFTGVLPYLLISWGQQHIDSGLGGVLFASAPLLTLVIGYLAFNAPRPGKSTILGAILGLCGVALAFVSPLSITTSALLGSAATVSAAASYAVGGLLIQNSKTKDIIGLTALQLVPSSLILVLCATLLGGNSVQTVSVQSYSALIGLGIIGTCVPLLSLFALVAREQAKVASLTTFFIPFVALVNGTVFLNEPLAPLSIVGLLAALFGTFLISPNRQK